MTMKKYFDKLVTRYPVLRPILPSIEQTAAEMAELFRRGGTFFVAGNGGSGADAEHICGELLKGFKSRRTLRESDKAALLAADPLVGAALGDALQYGLPAVSLLSHPALTSAFGNDVDPELAFAQQLWALGKPGDICMGISTGGNAANIYKTFAVARAKKIRTILLTGNRHGSCERLADIVIAAPDAETYRIQELHLPIYHTLCMAVESQFFTMIEDK
ncbi:MAG: SIS domain-containing protein [Lentisphaeria bacterium]|nr:SIS domain-containing protein [Lentisphaeria bacterium]